MECRASFYRLMGLSSTREQNVCTRSEQMVIKRPGKRNGGYTLFSSNFILRAAISEMILNFSERCKMFEHTGRPWREHQVRPWFISVLDLDPSVRAA